MRLSLKRNTRCMLSAITAFTLLCYSISSAAAHEFWIALKSGIVAPGDPVVGDLMVGVLLQGTPYPYLPQSIVRFDAGARGRMEAVPGLPGDLPALHYKTREAGLQVIVHQTVPFRVTYADWDVFRRYLAEEGFPQIEQLHLGRGIPTTGFSERYTRYVKALAQAGPPRPDDRDIRAGMPFELVAEENPYRPGLATLPVRLYWRDREAPDIQISILHRSDSVTRRTARTDRDGRLRIPLAEGTYLLSAVRIDPVENEPVVWSSHWAALSFVIPSR